MIDWAIVISTAVGFMVASITKVGEAVATKAGDELFAVVKKKFKGDKEGKDILSNFQKKPSRYKDALIDILSEKVEADKAFGDEIRSIIEKNSEIQNNVRITQNIKGAGNAVTAGNNSPATTNVTIKD